MSRRVRSSRQRSNDGGLVSLIGQPRSQPRVKALILSQKVMDPQINWRDVILVIVVFVVESFNFLRDCSLNHGWARAQHLLVDGHHMGRSVGGHGDALHGPADNKAALVVG